MIVPFPYVCRVTFALAVVLAHDAAADSVTLSALKDTSIFSNGTSNAAGGNDVLYFGLTSQGPTRRALVQFDVGASGIPSGSTIDAVTLTLSISGWTGSAAFGADRTVSLYRVTSAWGNGTTGSGGSGGMGGQGTMSAANGDVSWTYRSWSTTNPTPPHLAWTTAGGDLAATSSASLVISDTPTAVAVGDLFSWSGAGLVSDVQAWLDGTLTNNGWLLRDPETASGSLLRFYAKEYATAALRPQLTIDYTPVPEPAGWLLAATALAMMTGAARARRRTTRRNTACSQRCRIPKQRVTASGV